jgi:hypothetical protein
MTATDNSPALAGFSGDVLRPGTPAYDDARRVWNHAIDLTGMKDIRVDPVRRTATVQPGVIWRELDAATQAHGLAVPGGEVSDTGVAGLTPGRGHRLAGPQVRTQLRQPARGHARHCRG